MVWIQAGNPIFIEGKTHGIILMRLLVASILSSKISTGW